MKTDLCYKHNIIVSLFHRKKVNPSSLLLKNVDVMTTVYRTAILLRDPYGNTNIVSVGRSSQVQTYLNLIHSFSTAKEQHEED